MWSALAQSQRRDCSAHLPTRRRLAAGPDYIISHTPLVRLGTAEEIGKVVTLLASDASSLINGANIQADGGWAQI